MGRQVSILYSLKDNFTNSLRNIGSEQKKFEKNVKNVSKELQQLYDKRRQLKIDNRLADKAIKDTAKNAGKLGDRLKETMQQNVSKKTSIVFQMDALNKQIKQAERGLNTLNRKRAEPVVKVRDEASSTLNRIGSKLSSLTKSGLLAGGAVLAGAGAGLGYSLNLAGQREQSKIAFETMLKSKPKGQQMINDLTQFAVSTPYEYADLEKNATFALAMGFKDNDIISLLTDVGNASAGLSKGAVGIENMVRALGQMQNKGKVSMEEINQLSENGVKALEYLSIATGKSKAEMMKYIEKGLVPADKAIQAIRKGMRQDFGGMMVKQSKTLFGLVSNVKDFVNLNIFTSFGEGIRQGIMPSLTRFVDKLTNSKDGMIKWQEKLISIGKSIGTFLSGKVESVGNYIEKLFNDKQFNKADLGGKIEIVLDDIFNGMNKWYDSKGGEGIKKFFEKLSQNAVDILVVTLTNATPKLAEIGLKIGDSILKGIGQGLDKKIPFNEERAVIENKFRLSNASKYINPLAFMNGSVIKWGYEGLKGISERSKQQNGPKSRAIGVSRIPYDNYPIVAHEGEKLLTKQEANRGSSGSITIAKLADQIIVREEADIEKIADKLAKKIIQARTVYGGAY